VLVVTEAPAAALHRCKVDGLMAHSTMISWPRSRETTCTKRWRWEGKINELASKAIAWRREALAVVVVTEAPVAAFHRCKVDGLMTRSGRNLHHVAAVEMRH